MPRQCQPVLLIVLDGWGYSENTQYNAIHSAQKPVWDRLWATSPHMLISASGLDVGLPEHQMGNSEVGHMHLGAGRTMDQEFTRITSAIREGEFQHNPVLTRTFDAAAQEERAVHILGLLSPGGVHSHEDHILALMELAAVRGVRRIYIHAFLDGRDTPPKSAGLSLQKVMIKFNELGRCGRVASLIGRYYSMDRNQRWARTQAAYDLIADGRGLHVSSDPLIALDTAYARGETDEFVQATTIVPRDGRPVRVEDGDFVVFANFRADRARQLSEAFLEKRFPFFARARTPHLGAFITMTRYSDDYDVPAAFPPQHIDNTFGEYIARLGLKQLRIAETEKYAHVTYFFNGGEERVFPGEDRILVPSPHVRTYDQQPAMSAVEVTDRLVEAIRGKKYAAIVCNYANADMVGHTGNFEAAVKAIETLDQCLGRVETAAREAGMEVLITADHGNAEKMREVSTKHVIGQTHTAHTSNKVPLVYLGRSVTMAHNGTLADVAPTLLTIMGLPIPKEMTGKPLVDLPVTEVMSPATSTGRRAAF
ncbi:MAG TPA: 2,3-bisphosphoglycerate-independent phosphoglycerate mutase [Gammaproteobacteria bacterium]|nr:2,3-bisphosphoglycerate-independent phosphoglycerate mutase [Gammaproteobacteria bacterium]